MQITGVPQFLLRHQPFSLTRGSDRQTLVKGQMENTLGCVGQWPLAVARPCCCHIRVAGDPIKLQKQVACRAVVFRLVISSLMGELLEAALGNSCLHFPASRAQTHNAWAQSWRSINVGTNGEPALVTALCHSSPSNQLMTHCLDWLEPAAPMGLNVSRQHPSPRGKCFLP